MVTNWIAGREVPAEAGESFDKVLPTDETQRIPVARSRVADVDRAVTAAVAAQPAWAALPAVQRGALLHGVAEKLQSSATALASVVARETGKSPKDAAGEVGGAIALARFFAGEGQRLYGRTTTSGVDNRTILSLRTPIGVAGLIIAANTPIANVAWKVFPALICGNATVLKASEDAPETANAVARLAHDAGLPAGTFNVVHGFGGEAGEALVRDARVGVISFTGSTAVGRKIAVTAGERLARVSLELGGKNPLIVCDDADLENAVKWSVLSAFSNAGQRCAAASRLIVMDAVYDEFRRRLLAKIATLLVGPGDEHDFGPVINRRQLDSMLAAIDAARGRGVTVSCGGERLIDDAHRRGTYLGATVLENVAPDDPISVTELFGPITNLYRVPNFIAAIELANRTPYGLTACVHTASVHRAMQFTREVRAGTAVVNAGTYGSEPHLPFGGFGQSGNGSREPGTEALDVYSELKTVSLNFYPDRA